MLLSLLPNQREFKLFSVTAKILLLVLISQLVSPANAGNRIKGSSCWSDKDCDESRFLKCFEYKCNCDNATTRFPSTVYNKLVWDDIRGKCVSVAGKSCNSTSTTLGTVENKARNLISGPFMECIKNANCVNETCKCKHGFIHTPDGKCVVGYGESCNATSNENPCNHFERLNCRGGKCSCEFHGQMEYDHVTKTCRMLVGEACDNDNFPNECLHSAPIGACVRNAVCKKGSAKCKGRCVCAEGFQRTSRNTCAKKLLGYRELCRETSECDSTKFLACIIHNDPFKTRSCDCAREDMLFDGAVCRVNPGRACSQNEMCAEHSHCSSGFCICSQGRIINDTQCIPAPPCSNLPTDTWEWRKCRCELLGSDYEWHPSPFLGTECRAKIGTTCDAHNPHMCVPNASCECHVDSRYRMTQCHCVSNGLRRARYRSGVASVWNKGSTWWTKIGFKIAAAVFIMQYCF